MKTPAWLKSPIAPWWWPVSRQSKPRTDWGYVCKQVSARGRRCTLPPAHGKMHKAESGYKWADK